MDVAGTSERGDRFDVRRIKRDSPLFDSKRLVEVKAEAHSEFDIEHFGYRVSGRGVAPDS